MWCSADQISADLGVFEKLALDKLLLRFLLKSQTRGYTKRYGQTGQTRAVTPGMRSSSPIHSSQPEYLGYDSCNYRQCMRCCVCICACGFQGKTLYKKNNPIYVQDTHSVT